MWNDVTKNTQGMRNAKSQCQFQQRRLDFLENHSLSGLGCPLSEHTSAPPLYTWAVERQLVKSHHPPPENHKGAQLPRVNPKPFRTLALILHDLTWTLLPTSMPQTAPPRSSPWSSHGAPWRCAPPRPLHTFLPPHRVHTPSSLLVLSNI